MKKTRQIITLALALLMLLSLAAPAFASELEQHAHAHYISIANPIAGYSYAAYQIFAGDVDADGKLSNLVWGEGIPDDKIADMMTELKKVDAFKDCTDAKSVAAVLAGETVKKDGPIARAFADVVSQFATNPEATTSTKAADNTYKLLGLPDGYYLVKNTGVPTGVETTYTRYILEVVADVNVQHKGNFPVVDKVILDEGKELDTNEAFIGENVYYQIEGTLPSNIEFYDTYYYMFHDTMTKGLTYNNDMKITVNGVDVTKYFYIHAATGISTSDKYNGGTKLEVGIGDILVLDNDMDTAAEGHQYMQDTAGNVMAAITENTKVVMTYSATLNENAVVGGYEGNPNKVYLEYDNNPNNDGAGSQLPPPENPPEPDRPDVTGETPVDEVTTLTTELTIEKVDGTGHTLDGAQFTLESLGDTYVKMNVVTHYTFTADAAGEYWQLTDGTYTKIAPTAENQDHYTSTTQKYKLTKNVTVTPVTPAEKYKVSAYVSEDNGLLSFVGLGKGTYKLSETVTPSGYNTMADMTFEIHFEKNNATGVYDFYSTGLAEDGDNTLSTEIKNVAGSTLPSTGGIGTTLFYVFGGIMVAGAAILLVTKKRMGTV